MLPEVLAFLRAQKPSLVDDLVIEITAKVPQYSALDARELRLNIEQLFDDVLLFLEAGDPSAYTERLTALSRKRIAQGFSPSEMLQALLIAAPVVRDALRTAAPVRTPALEAAFRSVEAAIHEFATTAGALYVDQMARRMRAQNDALNRANQRLLVQEELLSVEVVGVTRALGNAQAFLGGVLESLSSGLIVVDSLTKRISLFTSRAEQILGIPAEEVIGQDVVAALGPLSGIDAQELVETVVRLGRLPPTPLWLTLDDGRRRRVVVRAHRVFDPDGSPKATVVVFDDVTREEMLADSLARFLPRDVAHRLLTSGADLASERRRVGVLVAEIRNFASLAETLAPEALSTTLDAFVHTAVEVTSQHGGFVDCVALGKIIAFFTDSRDVESTALAAAQAGVDLARRVGSTLLVGVGVEAGEVLLAQIGHEDRAELTLVGDAVCRADLLQAMAEPGQVLVGPAIARLAGLALGLRDLGARAVLGRIEPLDVYELRTTTA